MQVRPPTRPSARLLRSLGSGSDSPLRRLLQRIPALSGHATSPDRSGRQPRSRRPVLLGLAGAGLLVGGGLLATAPSLSAAAPGTRQAGGAIAPQAAAPAAPTPAAPAAAAPAPSAPAAAGNGLVQIESDSQQADNSTGVITATGNVRITYPDRRMVATARQAQYYSREGRLVLSGDVDVLDADGQRIRAERLVYLLDSERLQADPGRGRQVITRLRLQPRAGATAAPTLLP